MSTPIYYSYTDSGAPVCKGIRRALPDLFYACLCTGYGSKPGAGWTREYVNGTFDIAAFRNNTVSGTGFYLQVDGNSTTSTNQCKTQGYEIMTSENNGLFPFKDSSGYIVHSSTADSTARPWILIADERAFWFCSWYSITTYPTTSNNTTIGMFFGDIVCRLPSDSFGCAIYNWPSTSVQYSMFPGGMSSPTAALGGYLGMPRKSSGDSGNVMVSTIYGGGPTSIAYPGKDGLAYTDGDPILVTRPFINDGSAYTFRGFLPGMYYPCHPPVFPQLDTIVVSGKTYLSIRVLDLLGAYGNLFVSLDDWRT
jgi:hypothetical protein